MAENFEDIGHDFTVLCDHAADGDIHGKHTLVGLFRNINVASFPGGLVRFYVAFGAYGEGLKRAKIKMFLAAENGKWEHQLVEAEVTGELGGEPPGGQSTPPVYAVNIFVPVVGLQFPSPGAYEVRVIINDRLFNIVPFTVSRRRNADTPTDEL